MIEVAFGLAMVIIIFGLALIVLSFGIFMCHFIYELIFKE